MSDKEYDEINVRVAKLYEMIDDHDCHLTLEDGCDCQDWRMELIELTGQGYATWGG